MKLPPSRPTSIFSSSAYPPPRRDREVLTLPSFACIFFLRSVKMGRSIPFLFSPYGRSTKSIDLLARDSDRGLLSLPNLFLRSFRTQQSMIFFVAAIRRGRGSFFLRGRVPPCPLRFFSLSFFLFVFPSRKPRDWIFFPPQIRTRY